MRAQFYMLVVALIAAGSVQPATAQGGDAENGKDLFKVCRPCHQVGPDAKNGRPSMAWSGARQAPSRDSFIPTLTDRPG
jgi:cytochrome c2